MKRVFVSGGSGYIAMYCIKILISKGYYVVTSVIDKSKIDVVKNALWNNTTVKTSQWQKAAYDLTHNLKSILFKQRLVQKLKDQIAKLESKIRSTDAITQKSTLDLVLLSDGIASSQVTVQDLADASLSMERRKVVDSTIKT